MDTIGFVCDPDHPAFGPVARRLTARGFEVEFFRPDGRVAPADVARLSALASGVVHPTAFAALRYADGEGIPTWNDWTAVAVLSARLVTLSALDAVGCRVPDVRFDGPHEGYVPAYRHAWEGPTTLDDTAPFYVEAVGNDGVDYRYYAVDDGRETHMRALSVRTAVADDDPLLERAEVNVSLAAGVRELLDVLDARALAVDFTRDDEAFYAVRATPTPTFTRAGMDRRVADSVASLTTLGA